ncbi:hypothetical protein CROQUDRAFT_42100 [Cronartium quercuum f. sp. fusiforme G11]|uniref:Uncharacterized protein n=1 Tax=Cronartium quercuum f. sp. fusiforme G11 TaxID=708437 RepID=A0A9P6NLV0_9BASI|nr:hypothetical protein CROQUDRAFT_655537 [Cronartium quercuum f. sp. fusiforme G11]KAG0147942.1 hypothetical protein CROQUDRAFT_42100 [Cronartium quercuum f. sp. fusiforme G11]
MTSSNQLHPSPSQPQTYPLATNIPLIKAPGTWLPKPIVLPPDLHPMPDDITAYFVYPFTLETTSLNYLSNLSSNQQNLKHKLNLSQHYLNQRNQIKLKQKEHLEKEIEFNKKVLLKKLAPGWNGEMNSIISSNNNNTSKDNNSHDNNNTQ